MWWRSRIGEAIIRRFRDDTVRGVVATDAVIGTHTSLFDPELLANRCFLYHLIGRGTGEWLVPIGGMGALTDALLAQSARAGRRDPLWRRGCRTSTRPRRRSR